MLELLASGMTIDELLADYQDLEKENFLACIEYAAKLTQIKSIYRFAQSEARAGSKCVRGRFWGGNQNVLIYSSEKECIGFYVQVVPILVNL